MVIQETTTISHNNEIRDFKKNVLNSLDTPSSCIKVGLDSFEHPFEKVLLSCPGIPTSLVIFDIAIHDYKSVIYYYKRVRKSVPLCILKDKF